MKYTTCKNFKKALFFLNCLLLFFALSNSCAHAAPPLEDSLDIVTTQIPNSKEINRKIYSNPLEELIETEKLEKNKQDNDFYNLADNGENKPVIKSRRSFKEFIKGYRPDDALLLGMWSFHFDGEGEFSKYFYNTKDARNYNEANNLVGIQYASLCAATFTNSHNNQTFVLGVNRNLIDKKIGQTDLHFQSGYRAGIIYGYGDQFPNLGGISPVLFLTAGLKYKLFGVEINYVPGTPVPGIITRINLAPLLDKYKAEAAKKNSEKLD